MALKDLRILSQLLLENFNLVFDSRFIGLVIAGTSYWCYLLMQRVQVSKFSLQFIDLNLNLLITQLYAGILFGMEGVAIKLRFEVKSKHLI